MNENYIRVRSEDKSDVSNVKSTMLVADETGVRFYHADSGSGDSSKDRIWTLVLPNGNTRTKVTENSIGVYSVTSSGTEQLKWKLNIPDGEQQFKSISVSSPITKTDTDSSITIGHVAPFSAASDIGDNWDIELEFDELYADFTTPYFKINKWGHVTSFGTRKITIPINEASKNANGVMSSDAYTRLYDGTSFLQLNDAKQLTLTGSLLPIKWEMSGTSVLVNQNPEFCNESLEGIEINENCIAKVCGGAYFTLNNIPSSDTPMIQLQLVREHSGTNETIEETRVVAQSSDMCIQLTPKFVALEDGDKIHMNARISGMTSGTAKVINHASTYLNIELAKLGQSNSSNSGSGDEWGGEILNP